MTDRIELRSLRAMGICGVLPEEKARPQPIEIDLDVCTDLAPAGRSDSLEDTIDYGALCEVVERLVTIEGCNLLEHLAERIAETVLADNRVTEVVVSVRKLRPPVAQLLATSGVRITRVRSSAP